MSETKTYSGRTYALLYPGDRIEEGDVMLPGGGTIVRAEESIGTIASIRDQTVKKYWWRPVQERPAIPPNCIPAELFTLAVDLLDVVGNEDSSKIVDIVNMLQAKGHLRDA
jgi:hypothetical protein